ncbi:septation protein A [Paracoccus sp. S-4012]|uniref:inner membrane-spanning protein YciB n=1 Tax=Paracoccus sp. S-4012 TaxID=2665648 RepID=UPI0012AF364F|nr:inner membrane-spanning protein YciB [Paracoccus sp. S-4012]MRX49416.1 septation protein A [Paracoccus sp. S-4012]
MRKISPWVKPTLEYGPLLLFFVAYWLLRDSSIIIGGAEYSGFMAATLIFVPVAVASTLVLWRLTGKLSVMQAMTAVLLLVFGGLSLWLNDPRFFKMKPTIIYLIFAGLLGTGWLLGRNWLQLVMGEALPMRAEGWRVLTGRLIGLFLGLAVLNEIVWRTMSEAAWVNFKTFGLTAILFAFFIAQSGLYQRYAVTGDEPGPGPVPPPS